MGILVTLLAKSIAPFAAAQVARLLHDELTKGSPLDKAIGTVLTNIESHIPDPVLRSQVDELLRALLAVAEGTLSSALPAA